MHIERIHKMLECLAEKSLCEIEKGIENVNTEEMGEVIDMIKDLSEAEYYAKITKAMNEADEADIMEKLLEYGDDRRYYDRYRYADGRFAPKGKGKRRGYDEPPYYHMYPDDYEDTEHMRDMDKKDLKRMYTDTGMMGDRSYQRDSREGKAGISRRTYMETRENHHGNSEEDKKERAKARKDYLRDMQMDITEMTSDAAPEEKQMWRNELQMMLQKI